MENELDLTLRLGLASPTVGTHLSSLTPTTHQGINDAAGDRRDDNNNNGDGEINLRRFVGDDVVINDNEGARNNIDINLRVYNYVFQKFAGIGETLNFAPYPMPPSPAPAPVTPTANDYVLIDVPARRAQRNKALTLANAPDANADALDANALDANALDANALDANANAKGRHGYGFCGGCGRMDDGMIKCTNRNCNAITTPMWRRGPLGPKTLCNACGIKYRKEEERKSKSKSN